MCVSLLLWCSDEPSWVGGAIQAQLLYIVVLLSTLQLFRYAAGGRANPKVGRWSRTSLLPTRCLRSFVRVSLGSHPCKTGVCVDSGSIAYLSPAVKWARTPLFIALQKSFAACCLSIASSHEETIRSLAFTDPKKGAKHSHEVKGSAKK